MFVIGDEQQRIVPSRPVVQSVVNVVDELLAKRDVVVRMLAVAAGAEAWLEERIGGQCAGSGPALKIAEMAEMAFRRVLGVRVVEPSQRIAVIAIDRPVDILIGKSAENA